MAPSSINMPISATGLGLIMLSMDSIFGRIKDGPKIIPVAETKQARETGKMARLRFYSNLE